MRGTRRHTHDGWSRPAAVVLVVVAALAAGCTAPDRGPGPVVMPAPPDTPAGPDPAVVGRLVERYNDRIQLLDKTYGRGVIEFRWVDPDGAEHFEPQINAKLWIDLPRQTALRGEKLGDIYIWLGSDDARYWMFDLVGKTRRLKIGRHDALAGPEASVLVRPVTLLDLLGLTPLPAPEPGRVEFDQPRGAWVVSAEGAGGPIRVFLDPTSALPSRVEALDVHGEVALFSILRQNESVRLAGMSILALPRMATHIDIANPAGTVSVKLAFGEITGEMQARVFDLEALITHLRPDRIDGQEFR